MKTISVHLEITGEKTNWSWKLFHRQGNGNNSTAGTLPFPDNISPEQLMSFIKNGNLNSRSEYADYGATLHNAILPQILSDLFSNVADGDILFVVPPEWAQVPFELLFDKKGFFSERFRIGTIIQVSNADSIQMKNVSRPLSFAIIADPAGDLPMAYSEGIALRDALKHHGRSVRMISAASFDKFQEIFNGSSVVHYSGHSVFNESTESYGWKIGQNTIVDVKELIPDSSVEKRPLLVFSNSCEAAQTSAALSGVAGAFMQKGVAQIIGPISRVNDQDVAECALEFYRQLIKSKSPSEALYLTKKMYSKTSTALVFRLFGDPCWKFEDNSTSTVVRNEKKNKGLVTWILVAVIILIILTILFFPFPTGSNILYIPR